MVQMEFTIIQTKFFNINIVKKEEVITLTVAF